MTQLLATGPHLYARREVAEDMAKSLQKQDKTGWTYTVVGPANPRKGWHRIEVRNEYGQLVGYF